MYTASFHCYILFVLITVEYAITTDVNYRSKPRVPTMAEINVRSEALMSEASDAVRDQHAYVLALADIQGIDLQKYRRKRDSM